MQTCRRGIATCHAHQQSLNSPKEGKNDKAQECTVNMRPEDILAQLIPLVESCCQDSKMDVKVLDCQRYSHIAKNNNIPVKTLIDFWGLMSIPALFTNGRDVTLYWI